MKDKARKRDIEAKREINRTPWPCHYMFTDH